MGFLAVCFAAAQTGACSKTLTGVYQNGLLVVWRFVCFLLCALQALAGWDVDFLRFAVRERSAGAACSSKAAVVRKPQMAPWGGRGEKQQLWALNGLG